MSLKSCILISFLENIYLHPFRKAFYQTITDIVSPFCIHPHYWPSQILQSSNNLITTINKQDLFNKENNNTHHGSHSTSYLLLPQPRPLTLLASCNQAPCKQAPCNMYHVATSTTSRKWPLNNYSHAFHAILRLPCRQFSCCWHIQMHVTPTSKAPNFFL